MNFDKSFAEVWDVLAKENPILYAQVKPHVNRKDGRVTKLPDSIAGDVLNWVNERRAKQQAADAIAKAKAEEDARHRAAVAARDARRHAEFMAQHGTAIHQANHYAALQRILQYARERGLAEDPPNAAAITDWCLANGGMNPDNVDRAVAALSSKLAWSTFASRLRA